MSQHSDSTSAPLEIDDEDFRLFRNESNSALGSPPKRPPPSMRSDLSEIVVRYTGLGEQTDVGAGAGAGAGGGGTEAVDNTKTPPRSEATQFAEHGSKDEQIDRRSKRRSIMDAIHSASPPSNELGFKPQFRSNPLMDPHILAMAEQLQAHGEGHSPHRPMSPDEDKQQGKALASSPRVLDRSTENPPTPPSTPLAATSATEGK